MATRSTVLQWLGAAVLALGALQGCAFWPGSGGNFHDKLMTLGTAPEGGAFAPIGNALCDAINDVRSRQLVRCVVLRSGGSVFNVHAVANGSLQLGIAQEDVVAQVFGDASVKGSDGLRTLALLHETPVGVVVRRASGITRLDEIGRGVVNRGNKGSGVYAVAESVLSALGLEDKNLAGVAELPQAVVAQAFCAGKVDVVFNAVPHPSDQIARMLECGGSMLEIPDPVAQRMMARNPWMRRMDIPAGVYGSGQPATHSVGLRNLLVTHADVDPEALRRVASVLQEQHAAIVRQLPYLGPLRLATAADRGSLAAPPHPGALRVHALAQP